MRRGDFDRGDLKQWSEHRHKNRVFFGITLALIGTALMLRTMGVIPYFSFELTWPVILIVIGLLMGIKSNFKNNAWWILIVVGAANVAPQFTIMGRPSTQFVWPLVTIVVGLAIALRPRRDPTCYPRPRMERSITNESSLNIDVTFGGKKEVVMSRDFRGGMVSVTFAGCEINLNQADFADTTAVLDCRVSFGGLELIVPSHWEIQNEINPSFGNVEDERTIQTLTGNENRRILILRGNCSFGSIEIKSY